MLSSQRQIPLNGFNVFWIIAASAITVTLWSGSIGSVYGAPAKLDSNVTPFPLELQAPLFTDAVAAANGDNDNTFDSSKPSAIDSYGNPIESLKPIDTPDGRKVVSAQGLQFEIPNYASGITEIKKPSDDLLPPFVAPFEPTTTAEQDVSFPAAGAGTAIGVGVGSIPTKTTFTKSDDGKVITNNVFPQGGVGGQPPAKPFTFDTSFGTQQKDFQATHTNEFFSSSATGFSGSTTASGSAFGGAASFSKTQTATPTGFPSFGTAQQTTGTFGNSAGFGKGAIPATGAPAIGVSGGPGKYTGGFGGAPGVLGAGKVGYAVQADGSIRDPDHTFRPPIAGNVAAAAPVPVAAVTFAPVPVIAPVKSTFTVGGSSFSNRVGVAATGSTNSNSGFKYHGNFGGPPGILIPYDNVRNGK